MKQEFVQLQNNIKIVRTLKFFSSEKSFIIFSSSFNPNRGYGNQRRLFQKSTEAMEINGGYGNQRYGNQRRLR